MPLGESADPIPDTHGARASRVLIVDGDPSSLEIYRDFFLFLGFHVCETSDPSRALELAVAEAPDVVVFGLDPSSATMWPIVRAFRESPRTRDVVIVAVCGESDRVAVHEARGSGCDIVLTKPWQPAQLVHALTWTLSQPRARTQR